MINDENMGEVVRKGLLALVAMAFVIAVGTFGLVKILGLDTSEGVGPQVEKPAAPTSPLPTTALPVPEDEESDESESPDKNGSTDSTRNEEPGDEGLLISISPVLVRPMERINITGTYDSMDAVQVVVQREQNGEWVDFPVTADVRAGSFATYVMTSHTGDNKFRVYDPGADKASNAITVTVQ